MSRSRVAMSVSDALLLLDVLGSSVDPVMFADRPDERHAAPRDAEYHYHGREDAAGVALTYYARRPRMTVSAKVAGTLESMALDRMAEITGCSPRRATLLAQAFVYLGEDEAIEAGSVAHELGVSLGRARRALFDLARAGLIKRALQTHEIVRLAVSRRSLFSRAA